jgi:hypothetical protein
MWIKLTKKTISQWRQRPQLTRGDMPPV